MKESRLFKIIYYILEKEHVTAAELAEKFGVSIRTIYRDIDVISSSGVPIYTEAGRNGGIYIIDSFMLEKALFSDKEKQNILSSLQSLLATSNAYGEELVTKLSALFNNKSENWFEVDFSRWGNNKQDNIKFESLKSAVINHNVVEITYLNSYGEKTVRVIQPLKLLYKSNAWYVKSYCTKSKDFRIFKIHRIVDYKILDKAFTPVKFPDNDETSNNMYKQVILKFSEEVAYRVYDEFNDSEITIQNNDEMVVKADMIADAWLIGYLLSFGSSVKVISPSYLRDTLFEEAEKIYQINKR